MKVPLLLFCLVAMVTSPIIAAGKSKRPPLTEEQIRQILKETIIPQADFQNISLKEVVNFIDAEVRRRNPHGPRIPFRLDIEPLFGPEAPPEGADPAFVKGDPFPSAADTKLTQSLHDIPAFELLHYVTGLCNAEFHVRSDGVHVTEYGDPGPMVTRTFRIPSDFFPAFEREDQLCHTNAAVEMKENFALYFFPPGLLVPRGTAVILSDDATRVTVRTNPDRLADIQKLLETDRPASAFPVPGPNFPKVIEGSPREGVSDWRKAETETARKLRTIRIPNSTSVSTCTRWPLCSPK